jgi:hypothetical protein
VQALDENDAVQPFHERDPEAEPVHEQQVDRAVAPVDELHGHRADERRHDQRDHAQGLDQRRPLEAKTHGEIGQRHGDDRRHRDRHQGDVDRVPRRLDHDRGAEEIGEMDEGEAPPVPERDEDHGGDRHDQESDQEDRDRGGADQVEGRGLPAREQPHAPRCWKRKARLGHAPGPRQRARAARSASDLASA